MRTTEQKIRDRFGDRIATISPGKSFTYIVKGKRKKIKNETEDEVFEIFSRLITHKVILIEED